MRILVLIDGTANAAAELARAVECARERRAPIEIVSVVRPRPFWHSLAIHSGYLPEVFEAEEMAEREASLRALVATLPADVCVRWSLRFGKRATVAARLREESPFDLVPEHPLGRRISTTAEPK